MKKILNKKGFTLVELLAVIVVLAIIMLVVANRVGDAMKTSRGDSLVLQIQSMQKEMEKKCILNNKITETEINSILHGSDLTLKEATGTSIKVQAEKGSKFANIAMPSADKIPTDIVITGTDEPVATFPISCPIE